MPKATQIEHDKRVETVKQFILAGVDVDEICQDVAIRFGVGTRQALRYVSYARKRIMRRVEADRDAMFAEHIAHRRDMRKRARQTKDLRAELSIAQDEAKLWGLYPADEHRIAGADGGALTIKLTWGENERDNDTTAAPA
jgi:hypothetical protein